MINPIFSLLDFGDEIPVEFILELMDFEIREIDGFSQNDHDEFIKYNNDRQAWIASWNPPVPDGYYICKIIDEATIPFALIAKPTTELTKALVAFANSSSAKEALEKDMAAFYKNYPELAKSQDEE